MCKRFFEIEKKVYLADTDVTGIAYYARHLEWMEMARVEWLSDFYKPLTRLIAEEKFSFVPVEVKIQYKSPALFEDVLTIRVGVQEIDKIRLTLQYQICKKSGEQELTVATAQIIMLCVSLEKTTRPQKIPPHFLTAITNWENAASPA